MFIFGQAVSGTDIDLILAPNPKINIQNVYVALFLSEKLNLDPYKSIKFSLKVAGELERRIKPRFDFDVKILNSTPLEFQFEVIKTRYLLQGKSQKSRLRI